MLCVFAMHATLFLLYLGYDWTGRRLFIEAGRTGLAAFFVMSGLLLYLPFAFARLTRAPPPALAAYYVRRGIRIIPAYWVALIAIALWQHDTAHLTSFEDAVTQFGFLQVYSARGLAEGIRPVWAVDNLVLFYLLLPLWAAGMRRIPAPSVAAFVRTEAGTLAALALASMAWKVVAYRLTEGTSGGSRPSQPLLVVLPAFLDYMAAGMGLAVAFAAVAGSGKLASAADLYRRRSWLIWLGAAATWALVVSIDPWADIRRLSSSDDVPLLAVHVLMGLTVAGVTLGAMFATPRSGLVPRVLGSPLLLWLGLVSYSFFLWHGAILQELWPHLLKFGPGWYVAGALAASVAVAAVSYYLVEKPALRLGKHLPRQASRAPPAFTGSGVRAIPAVAPACAVVALAIATVVHLPVKVLSEPVRAELATNDGRKTIVSSWGTARIVDGAVGGAVERVSVCGQVPTVAGWAADIPRHHAAEHVLVFADNRLLLAGRPERKRPDLTRRYGPGLTHSGFVLIPPAAAATAATDPYRVRVFAMAGRRASELRASSSLRVNPAPGAFRASLVEKDGRLSIVSSSARARVVPGAVHGYVESLVPFGPKLVVSGWAADRRGGRPADCVLAFAGGRLLGAGPPTASRPDVARLYASDVDLSGFRLAVKGSERRPVRVFGVAGRRATELPRWRPSG
jgi:peptidoglycan/LPS O-acetylase OafA/YrhL